MPKITNDGLTWSDTGCFIAVPYGNSGRQMVNSTCYLTTCNLYIDYGKLKLVDYSLSWP